MFPQCKTIGCHSSVIVGRDYCACCAAEKARRVQAEPASEEATPSIEVAEYTGGSVSYYLTPVRAPMRGGAPYEAECGDIIEALGMDFNEGNAFKAIWRMCAARTLKLKKAGYTDGVYDAEKVVYYGERMVALASLKQTD